MKTNTVLVQEARAKGWTVGYDDLALKLEYSANTLRVYKCLGKITLRKIGSQVAVTPTELQKLRNQLYN